jgi:hypothetical protein
LKTKYRSVIVDVSRRTDIPQNLAAAVLIPVASQELNQVYI